MGKRQGNRTARRLAAGGLLAVAALCLAGCGISKYEQRRDAVNAYFVAVDRAEAPLVRGAYRIDRTFSAFKIAGNSPQEVRRLEGAQKQIAVTLGRVHAIRPPAAAAKIHSDIVELLGRQESVASDLVLTTSYVPKLSAVLVPLQRADSTLTRDLNGLDTAGKGAKAPLTLSEALAGFATAFASYGSALRPVAAKLDALQPPLELRNELLVQRRAVRRSIALSSAIVAALDRKDVKTANADIHTLFTLAPQTSVIGTAHAEQQALHAYNARLASITQLEIAIDRERNRLIHTVG